MPMNTEVANNFKTALNELLLEAEMFLSKVNTEISAHTITSIAGRLEYIADEAEKNDFHGISSGCKSCIAFFTEHNDLAPHCKKELLEIFEALRLGAEFEVLAAKGKKMPEEKDDFTSISCTKILEHLIAFNHEQNAHDKFNGIRVLVADDEDIVRLYLEETLDDSGYLVMGVKDGQEAMTVLETGYFDIIFSDINMPFASGIDVLKFVKEKNIVCNVIVITGNASIESATEALRLGAYDYITKPFANPSDLITVVSRARSHIELKRSNESMSKIMLSKNLELKRYAEGLEEALANIDEKNNALLHADRMATLGVLVAGLAHEINNPNTFIRGNLQNFKKFWPIIEQQLREIPEKERLTKINFIMEETPTLLRDMLVGTERISRITNGLRSFARAENKEDIQEHYLKDIVDAAINLVGNRFTNEIELQIDVDASCRVLCSEQQITQVLLNLLTNAADAVTATQKPLVRIYVKPETKGVGIFVEDNGTGICKDIQSKIFDPFFTTKAVDKGTGLGLSISAGIAQAHGGSLTLVHSDSDGSTLKLFVPVSHQNTKATSKTSGALLIPQKSFFRALESTIKSQGLLSLNVYENPEKFLKAINKDRPKIIIIDTDTPGLDIFALLEATQGFNKLILTEQCNNHLTNRFYELGANKVLFKPYKLNEMLSSINRLVMNNSN